MDKKEYLKQVWGLIEEYLKKLPHTDEDTEKIQKLWKFYGRKKNIESGKAQSLAGALLWAYARINFLWEQEGNVWQQKSLSEISAVGASTLGQKATSIIKGLKMYPMDQRFAREEMAEKDPMNKLRVDPKTGMLFFDDGTLDGLVGVPVKKDKHNYYYDAMEYINLGDIDYAIKLLHKALEIDEHYVAGYIGMTTSYKFKENNKKIHEYTNKAYEETKRVFPKWPDRMIWGIMENRQYLRALCDKAVLHWEDGEKEEAIELFKLILKLNPNDNQGIRYLLAGMYAGKTLSDVDDIFDRANETQNRGEEEGLLDDQNKIHNFWLPPDEE